MEKSKKRTFAVLASLFTLILSLLLIAVNGLVVAEKLLVKFAKKSILKAIKMKPFTQLRQAMDTLQPKKLELAIMGVLALVGLILLILSFKNFKKKNKKGDVNYGGKRLFVAFLIAVAVAVLAFLAYTSKKAPLVDVCKIKVIKLTIFAYLGLAGISVLLILISALCKKGKKKNKASKTDRVFKTAPVANYAVEPVGAVQPMTADMDTSEFAPIVLVVQDKIAKINQLRAMGVISESQYNAAVSRLINSI